MKKSFFTVLLLVFVIFTSCAAPTSDTVQPLPSSAVSPEQTGAVTTPTPSVPLDKPFIPEEGEVRINIMLNTYSAAPPNENVLRFNHYLREKGYGFYVDIFRGTTDEKKMYEALARAKERSTPVDLVLIDEHENALTNAVEAGLLQPLTSFLQQESNEDWVREVSQNYWEAIRVGEGDARAVYGLTSAGGFIKSFRICINEELFEEAGISLPEELCLADLPELLQMLSEKGYFEKDIAPLIFQDLRWGFLWRYIGGVYNDAYVPVRYQDGRVTPVNIFAEEAFREAVKVMYTCFQNGWICEDYEYDPEENNFAIKLSPMLAGPYDTNENLKTQGMRAYDFAEYMDATLHGFLCVTSWAEHPKEAQELIKVLYTDADAANLLYYGETQETVKEEQFYLLHERSSSLVNMLLVKDYSSEEEKAAYLTKLSELPYFPVISTDCIQEITFSKWWESEEVTVLSRNFLDDFRSCASEQELDALLDKYEELYEKSEMYAKIKEEWSKQP